jgi:hypothetical protein
VSQPTLTWTPTAADYQTALAVWRDASGATARTRMMGATLMAFGAIVSIFALTQIRALGLALIPLVGVVGIGWIWNRDLPSRWGLRGAISRSPAMLEPTTIVVEREGLLVSNGAGSQRIAWSEFAAHMETDDLMLLGLSLDSPAVSGILARRAAASGADWDTATARVRSHVPVHPRIAHLRAKKAA